MINKQERCQKILVTGARFPWALELMRRLHEGGHEVYAVDINNYNVARYSNCVKEYIVVPPPHESVDRFIEGIMKVAYEKGIDLIIPIWEEAMYLTQYRHLLPEGCHLFCDTFENLHTLHHKWLFVKYQEKNGIPFPKTVLIESKQDLNQLKNWPSYVIKRCYSSFCQGMSIVMDPNKELDLSIDEKNPWIAQEFLPGKKYCTYSVCHNGKVYAHSTYPVQFTMEGSSCIVFEAIDQPECIRWVERLVKTMNYTGQISFDFIEDANGQLYAIECNPRSTSGVVLFDRNDRLDRAFFHENEEVIYAKTGKSQQIVMGMLMYGWRTAIKEQKFPQYLKKFFSTKDVIFSCEDVKPFCSKPFVMGNYYLKGLKYGVPLPTIFTRDLNWIDVG